MAPYSSLSFLILCWFALAACSSSTEPQTKTGPVEAETQTLPLLVGAYTDQESKGIYQLDFDLSTGTLSSPTLLVETGYPSFLAYSSDREYVFAVNETKGGQASSFQWNDDHSQLVPLSQQATEGDYPCHVERNESGTLLAAANYGSGNITVFQVLAGQIQASPTVRQHTGSGPVSPNQTSAHAHCSKFGPGGKFLYTVDLGTDQIVIYPVSETGTVGPAIENLEMDPGDGPRHLIFHPTQDLAFVVNELSSTVASFQLSPETGKLEPLDKISTLPDAFSGTNYCADIHLSSNGKFLYASNRGHNSIAVFSVGENGRLERIGVESVRGDWPRNFTLSPDEKHLLVANQKSNNITVFAVDPATGLLTYTGQEIAMSKPVMLLF